jgi:hypothetical protein
MKGAVILILAVKVPINTVPAGLQEGHQILP